MSAPSPQQDRPSTAPTGVVASPRTSGLGIAATILGGVALLLSAVPILNLASPPLAVVGLALGITGIVLRSQTTPLAVTGAALSALAALISLVLVTVFAVVAVDGVTRAIERGLPGVTAPDREDRMPPGDRTLGSWGQPLPIDTPVAVTENGERRWELVVGAAIPNVDDLVEQASPFNEPAPDGMQYIAMPLSVVNIGDDAGQPWYDLHFAFIAGDGSAYDELDTLVTVDDALRDLDDLRPGESGSGIVVIAVPSGDIGAGVWRISAVSGDRELFVALS